MLKRIISIAGKPGLFKLISQGKNMLIVETIGTGKRLPIYAHDKVVSLGDISIYTNEGDIQLPIVLDKVKAKAEGKPIDVKAFANDEAIRDYFGEILPEFDRDRVYTTDIKKLISWYNILVNNGMADFVEPKEESEAKEEATNEETKE